MRRKHITELRHSSSFLRKPGHRETKPVVMIACEGQTECAYFAAIRTMHGLHSVEIAVEATGRDPMSLVRYAESRVREDREGFDNAICVFDRDTHAHFAEARARIKKLAAGKKSLPIMEAVTIPAFEFWILLHFERTAAPFENSEQIINRLKLAGHIPNFTKSNLQWCREVVAKAETAIANAHWLNEQAKGAEIVNPFTNIHLAVELLRNLKKPTPL